ncbi:MAG TPA: glycosyl hydrolase [Opitutaceae bacterium]|nr:glycosyl hydrolase [Opitutaceae bacterium]
MILAQRVSCILLATGLAPALSAAQFWQEVTMPTVAEAAAAFPQPPKEYAAIHWATGFPQPKETIVSAIANTAANGGGVYMINSGGRNVKYLSPEYFDLMKVAVDELKKRGMKMWIDGDDGYPDGFAGGMISKLHPELGMQAIVADGTYTVEAGQTLSIPLPPDTLGILSRVRPEPTAAASGRGARAAAPAPAPVPAEAGAAATPPAAGGARAGAQAGRQGRAARPATVPAASPQMVPVPADGPFKWTAPAGGLWYATFQGSAGEARYSVFSGQTLTMPLPPGTKSIQADLRTDWRPGQPEFKPGGPTTTPVPLPANGQFTWTAPASGGPYQVIFVRHVYRSSPTRYGQREDGTRDKDSLYSLIDYLDAKATAAYIELVPETYGKYFGAEFGRTILGFRGDETDFTGFIPWTPKLLETFQRQKGYDLQPYIAQFFGSALSPEVARAQADYFDVWSGMFRDNFFKPMQEWCRAHGMDYMMHLNHEELMLNRGGGEDMTKNEGSFFRDMRYMGVPGVDNLSQIAPGIVADFPKLAGSAAHLFGHPQAWTESGGSLSAGGKFVIDYQLVRGINFMNIRGLNIATPPASASDASAATGWYVTRAGYLMAVGRPAAQVALYHPSDSYWLNDFEADDVTVKLTTELMEHQVDFDHIDHDTLASICTLEGGTLKNLSGQAYRAVVVPTSTVIQKNVLDRLRAFAAAGGKVIFVGRTPTMVVDRTFLHATGAPDLKFATLLEPTPAITPRVLAALPHPDVKLDADCAPLKYMHRTLKDGDVYFFFNESDQPQARTATLDGRGQVQTWNAADARIQAVPNLAPATGSIAVPLTLAPHESRFIVIGPLPPGAG